MWCLKTVVFLLVSHFYNGMAQEPMQIFFGGLFEDPLTPEDNTTLDNKQAFQFAVKLSELTKNPEFVFEALIEPSFPHRNGPFQATITTCSLIDQQALVIFGPKQADEIVAVQSVCDDKDIALVITSWVPHPEEHRNIINFYPHYEELLNAYYNILAASGWKTFTLVYDDNDSLLKLGNLINTAKNSGFIVSVKQLDDGAGTYRKTFKEIVESGQRNIMIDCRIELLQEVLTQAQQVGLMTSYYNYFITNLDLQVIDLEPFRYSGANITGLRIFDPESDYSKYIEGYLKQRFNSEFEIQSLKTEAALIMDATAILTDIFNTKLSSEDIKLNPISCNSIEPVKYGYNEGYTLSNHVKNYKDAKLTGLIEFDGNGFRSNFNLDVIAIKEDTISKIATWNATKHLVSALHPNIQNNDDTDSLRNRSFKVLTALTAPFTMLKETSEPKFGNDRFEGFAVDLIQALAEMEGFNYTFMIRDSQNGAKQADGTWTGMIGDIIDHTADLAITDLTITADREKAVDFTSPFMYLGISILAKKPENAPPSFFSFADPFALDTWVMLGISYVAVLLSFFIMGRLCQDEWTNPYPCIEEPEFLINQFTLANSAWFAMGALMQQGSEIAPIAISTRMVSGMWWFFVLIMVSSYTASLAAFLATENPVHLFTDVDSLVANQEKYQIRIGAKNNGATRNFFKGKTDNPSYAFIDNYMEKHTENLVEDNKIGVSYAEKYTYAFFMESTSIAYEIQRHCGLQEYGKPLDDKGYGIAMRKNSTYRTKLSTGILKLQGSGELDKLRRKWWEEKRGGGQCGAGSDDDTDTPPLEVKNVEGVFYVTIGGTLLAIFLVIADFLLNTRKISKKTEIPFKEVLRLELKALSDFNSNVKPTIKPRSKSGSKSSSQETGNSNNNLMPPPAPYGFIPTITKDELND